MMSQVLSAVIARRELGEMVYAVTHVTNGIILVRKNARELTRDSKSCLAAITSGTSVTGVRTMICPLIRVPVPSKLKVN